MKNQNQKKEIGRRDFLRKTALTALSVPLITSFEYSQFQKPKQKKSVPVTPEWRNKQEGMYYRQLGRTGFMVSEIVFGTERIKPENIRPIEAAIERGVNYLDTAPQYGKGASETAIGLVLKDSSKREKVFLATKISPFPGFRNRLYKEIFDGLPASKQETIQKKAQELRKNGGIEKPGYFLTYWPNQSRQLDGVFLSDAMMEEYGEKVESNPGFRETIIKSVEESLKRVGTDYFDVLHCPHAANTVNEIKNPYIFETFKELKKQGKVRYLGFSTHTGMTELLNAAIDSGNFDCVLLAYNVIVAGYLDHVIKRAKENNVGTIAMKAAMAVATPYNPEQVPVPEWRIQKLNQIIPGDMKLQLKAYLWALQNPDLSTVVSGITTEEMLNENLSVIGKKIELRFA